MIFWALVISTLALSLLVPSLASDIQAEAPAGSIAAAPLVSTHWTNLTARLISAPPKDWGWASAYDAALRVAIFFGGCPVAVLSPCVSETWSFSSSLGWDLISLKHGPSPRQGAAMAYDPLLHKVVVFGGVSPSSILGDTWEWNRSGWTDISGVLVVSPPPRYDVSMVWDPAVDAIVLFGGSGCGSAFCGDTWEFNGTWIQVTTGHSPTPRAWPGLAFDRSDGVLLLTSGQTTGVSGGYRALRDTWIFNGTDWQQLHPRAAPQATAQPVVCYDGVTREVLFVGDHTGETWIYRAGIWSNVTSISGTGPSARALPAATMDVAGSFVLVFGGGGNGGGLNDTWAWT